jgi:hypothetical protein
MVTVMLTFVDNPPPPVMLNVHAPAAIGVIVNDAPVAAAIVAMPLHEFG